MELKRCRGSQLALSMKLPIPGRICMRFSNEQAVLPHPYDTTPNKTMH